MYRVIRTEHIGVSNKSLDVTNIINSHEISINLKWSRYGLARVQGFEEIT